MKKQPTEIEIKFIKYDMVLCPKCKKPVEKCECKKKEIIKG